MTKHEDAQVVAAVGSPLEPTVRPCLTVYGDGVHDDAEALQAYLDGKADLIHADGTPYAWPGAPGRMYHISHTLYVGRTTGPRVKHPLDPVAVIGAA